MLLVMGHFAKMDLCSNKLFKISSWFHSLRYHYAWAGESPDCHYSWFKGGVTRWNWVQRVPEYLINPSYHLPLIRCRLISNDSPQWGVLSNWWHPKGAAGLMSYAKVSHVSTHINEYLSGEGVKIRVRMNWVMRGWTLKVFTRVSPTKIKEMWISPTCNKFNSKSTNLSFFSMTCVH